jgi:hypothetical protein
MKKNTIKKRTIEFYAHSAENQNKKSFSLNLTAKWRWIGKRFWFIHTNGSGGKSKDQM